MFFFCTKLLAEKNWPVIVQLWLPMWYQNWKVPKSGIDKVPLRLWPPSYINLDLILFLILSFLLCQCLEECQTRTQGSIWLQLLILMPNKLQGVDLHLLINYRPIIFFIKPNLNYVLWTSQKLGTKIRLIKECINKSSSPSFILFNEKKNLLIFFLERFTTLKRNFDKKNNWSRIYQWVFIYSL